MRYTDYCFCRLKTNKTQQKYGEKTVVVVVREGEGGRGVRSRPIGRITCLARPSVWLSVYLSVCLTDRLSVSYGLAR